MPKLKGEPESGLSRFNVILADSDSRWLDELSTSIEQRHGKRVTRSQILRAGLVMLKELEKLSSMLPDRFCSLTVARSERELAAIGVLALRSAAVGGDYTPQERGGTRPGFGGTQRGGK